MASSQEMGNNYIYFFFSEIDFDLFYRQFNQKYKFEDKDVALKFYDDWFVVFDKRRYVFYRAQYKQHFELVQNAFSKQYNIPIDESPSVYGLEEHWRKFKIENGLDSHRDKLDRLEERNKHREEEARQRSNIPKSYSLPELHERFSEIFSDVAAGNRPSTKEINTFWFNTTISNGKEKIKSLKELPYTEYLATTHWQRVRSAMLLIHGARCQEESCYQMFESWYFGFESDIDVHHLNYRNKGNERYDDFALLCKEHHTLWHDNIKLYNEPRLEILDDSWF